MTAERKTDYTVDQIKRAFPDYSVFHSDDPSPVRASILLPKAMFGTIDLVEGIFKTDITASFGNDEPCKYSSSDETKAYEAISDELLPQWRAAGFEPLGGGFAEENESGLDAEYCLSMCKSVPTLADLEKTIQWIADEAETDVRV